MRVAVISDIHGNLEAFREVLTDIDRSRVDCVVSLGDNIGYGPDPEGVLLSMRARNIPSVMGNHELGIADPSYLSWFNLSAQRSLRITRSLLTQESIDYIKTLRASLVVNKGLFVHGFPPDSITTYLFEVSDTELHVAFLRMEQDVCFVGHTHELDLIAFESESVRHHSLTEGKTELREGCKYIVNAGSVGQPRDGDNRAKYLIWDDQTRSLTVRYIPYDIATTAEKILALGFPEINARRLW